MTNHENSIQQLRSLLLNTIEYAHKIACNALRDQNLSNESTISRERREIQKEPTPDRLQALYNQGRKAAAYSGVNACHNVAALYRIFTHADDEHPANFANFTLTRTAIEGSALCAYLSDPGANLNVRLLRTAQVMTWSNREQLAFTRELNDQQAIEYAEREWDRHLELLQDCQITLAGGGDQPWHKLARKEKTLGKFSQIQTFRSLRQGAYAGYRQLSGIAHHAPWILDPQFTTTNAEFGTSSRSDVRDDQLVQLAANSCHATIFAAASFRHLHGGEVSILQNALTEIDHKFASIIETMHSLRDQLAD